MAPVDDVTKKKRADGEYIAVPHMVLAIREGVDAELLNPRSFVLPLSCVLRVQPLLHLNGDALYPFSYIII